MEIQQHIGNSPDQLTEKLQRDLTLPLGQRGALAHPQPKVTHTAITK